MSVSGISSGSLFELLGAETTSQSQKQQLQQEIQQLGKDFSAGNLSAAQADFATLQKDAPQASAAATQSNNPIAQAFQKLAQDLQSGNLSAAQQDFSTVQQDVQAQASGGHHHHSHGQSSSGAEQSPLAQLFSELGQALQSGNLAAAQQAYTTLQQDFQSGTTSVSSSGTSSAAGSVQTVA
jgi:outer membrane protein assembly factor BamD (BamD/ComL family)